MLKILTREFLILICTVGFGAVIIPTFLILIMAIFGDMPRNESLFEGFDALRFRIRGQMWIAYLVAFGPYVLFQAMRFASLRWGLFRGSRFDPFTQKEPYTPPDTGGLYCDSSMMSWRDAFDDFDPPSDAEKIKDD